MIKNNLNKSQMAGEVVTEPSDYEWYGKIYKTFHLETTRLSGVKDDVLVIVEAFKLGEVKRGDFVQLEGSIRSFHEEIEQQRRLVISFFAEKATKILDHEHESVNEVVLEGYVCKPIVFRETPAGFKISDVMIAVNRGFKCDYIPLVLWNEDAEKFKGLEMGAKIAIKGRLQSRAYLKEIAPGEVVRRFAQEISVSCGVCLNEEEVC